MSDPANNPNRRRLFSFRKRGQQIVGHQTGDIQSDEPVAILNGAVLVGNVTAPQIRLAGLMRGTAVTQHLIIEAEGQIWGDVLTVRLQIEPGGVIHGWVSSPGASPTPEDDSPQPPELPDELAQHAPPDRNDAQRELWRHLQTEAGKALTAHARLTQQFETRLMEEAGTALEKVETLTQEMSEAQAHLFSLQQRLEGAEATIENQQLQIDTQAAALVEADKLSNQQKQQLEERQQTYEALSRDHDRLLNAKNSVDLSLAQTQRQVDDLIERARTLETTLQASIQRTVEQEDALLHWQELAESTQSRLAELEKERATLERQLEETAEVTGKLRRKNSRLEFEWQQTLTELDELRKYKPNATVEELQFSLADTQQQIVTLKNMVTEARRAAADSNEQALWYKANWQTAQRALDQSRQIAGRQEALLNELRSDAAEFEAQKAELNEALRHKSAQLDAHEAEIEHHVQQSDAQGQRLAEIQAALIERELQLNQAKAKVAKQSEFIARMKRVTNDHIQRLEAQLAQAQGALKRRN